MQAQVHIQEYVSCYATPARQSIQGQVFVRWVVVEKCKKWIATYLWKTRSVSESEGR